MKIGTIGAGQVGGTLGRAWAAKGHQVVLGVRDPRGPKVRELFNTIGAQHMANPRFGTQSASMLLCGDDLAAKKTVLALAEVLGFDPVDAGPLTQARLLEPLAMLWISLASADGHGPDIAFKLLRR